MYLTRIHLNPRCKEARRDLADPYQLHSTLARAFCAPDTKCPPGSFLWRLEPESDHAGLPRILVQSRVKPEWDGIGIKGWLERDDPSIDLEQRLKLASLRIGRRFRFRLRANPCVTREGKRLGLLSLLEQEKWIVGQGRKHGFSLTAASGFDLGERAGANVDVKVSEERMLRGRQRTGNDLRIFSVLYDGSLSVTDPPLFVKVLEKGIGHGKVLGLGLLSVAPQPAA